MQYEQWQTRICRLCQRISSVIWCWYFAILSNDALSSSFGVDVSGGITLRYSYFIEFNWYFQESLCSGILINACNQHFLAFYFDTNIWYSLLQPYLNPWSCFNVFARVWIQIELNCLIVFEFCVGILGNISRSVKLNKSCWLILWRLAGACCFFSCIFTCLIMCHLLKCHLCWLYSTVGIVPENARFPDTVAICYTDVDNRLTCVYNDHSIYIWDVSDIRKVGKTRSFLFHSGAVWGIDVSLFHFLQCDSF